jgi:hypothetical protein
MYSAADNNNYPRICSEVGLTCESCTKATARELAAVCKGLRGKAIGQLFVQIYPNSACAPMHSYFAARYRDASCEIPVADEPAFERREVVSAGPRAFAAVA